MVKILRNYDSQSFLKEYNERGIVTIQGNYDDGLLQRLKDAMLDCIEIERKLIKQPDTNSRDYGFVLCAPYYLDKYPFLLDVFNDHYLAPVEWILEKWFILYLYSCNCLPPDKKFNKAAEIHVDTPRFSPPNYNTLVATLINMDEFSEENGATWMLPSSHLQREKPTEKEFYEKAIRLTMPKGSICFFNPRIWHATGLNKTQDWRTCLIIAFCKPWMKQRLDIPRFIQHIDKNTLSDKVQQLLGFNCQPPGAFSEFYGPGRTFTQPFV
jgi:hypothetical protein